MLGHHYVSDAAQDLEATIRAKLASGELPSAKPDKVWAGKGTGQPCSACGAPIAADDIEYEVVFLRAEAAMRLHRNCLAIWDQQRTDLPPSGGRAPRTGAA